MIQQDKENPSVLAPPPSSSRKAMQFATTNGCSKLDTLMSHPITCCTPKNKPTVLAEPGSLTAGERHQRRRALGDLLNTGGKSTAAVAAAAANRQKSTGMTPKLDRAPTLKMPKLCITKEPVVEQLNEEPVERFIGSKYDSFDDLFPDGRLSELFMQKNVRFVANMPTGLNYEVNDEKMRPTSEYVEEIRLPTMRKLLKKARKMDLTLQEFKMPEELEDPLLDMLKDLNL
jgi:hypothetical protein